MNFFTCLFLCRGGGVERRGGHQAAGVTRRNRSDGMCRGLILGSGSQQTRLWILGLLFTSLVVWQWAIYLSYALIKSLIKFTFQSGSEHNVYECLAHGWRKPGKRSRMRNGMKAVMGREREEGGYGSWKWTVNNSQWGFKGPLYSKALYFNNLQLFFFWDLPS